MSDATPHYHDTDRAADTCPVCFPDAAAEAAAMNDPPAVTAATEAISAEYVAIDGNPRARWSRDLAIIALEAAGPLIADRERDRILGEGPAQGVYRLGMAADRAQIRQLAIKHHASYAVNPDAPFSVLREFADLLGETP